jgi:hypothetical protein
MKKITGFLLGICLCLIGEPGLSQALYQVGARSAALGEITSAVTGSWSVFGNQAGLSGLDHWNAGISYSNRFLLRELSTQAAFVSGPVSGSVVALSYYQFGKSVFRESKAGFAVSKILSRHFSAGVQFDYLGLYFPEENRTLGTFTMEGGFLYSPAQPVIIGCWLFNPYGQGVKTISGRYTYPTILRAGLQYKTPEKVTFWGELEQRTTCDAIGRFALEYEAGKDFFLRCGFAGKPYLFSSGIGYQYRSMVFDLAISYTRYLGSSPQVSVFKKF